MAAKKQRGLGRGLGALLGEAAEGAENPVIQSKITEAVATVCDVPYSSVAVYSMS